MFNQAAFQNALSKYKEDFVENTWPAEKYKWEAVQHFQDNWDIDADDFPAMLKQSLSKTGNLLASSGRFPRVMIQRYSAIDPERVRSMFRDLFDEAQDLFERVDSFKRQSELLEQEGDVKGKHHQDENSMTTYLWLRYPDKYYIYKWSVARAVAEQLEATFKFKKGAYESNLSNYLKIYNELASILRADEDMRDLLDSQLTDKDYPDPELNTLAIDLGYYIGVKGDDLAAEEASSEEWWPPKDEYHPGLSVEDWKELLQNPEVFTESNLEIMARMKDIGGFASCVALAQKYGKSYNFYNSGSSYLAKRIARLTGCPVPTHRKDGDTRWWPILYTGRRAESNEVGSYIWRLRPELSEALDRIDLSDVEISHLPSSLNAYQHTEPLGLAGNYWWLVASPKQTFRFDNLSVGEEEPWSVRSPSGALRQIPQNFKDAQEGDLVIGYESSPVKQIVALGQILRAPDEERLWFKKTESLVDPLDLGDLQEMSELQGMQAFKTNIRGSLFKLSEEEYQTIFDLVREKNPDPQDRATESYNREDFLSEVFMPPAKYDRIVNVLRRKKNIILQGAPGVGKTFAAERLAWAMMGEKDPSRVEFVQFHQNYSYEDFVMGYKPSGAGFNLEKGVFHRFCRHASNNLDTEHFFIIDEINRGNMSKVFGELLMLIEDGYRDRSVTLAYDGMKFAIPRNVHIIGMMNTADRSLAMIDYALRRRFSFITMEPGFETEGFKSYQTSLANPRLDQLIDVVEDLNTAIANDTSLGRGFCIGHSYFTGQEEADAEWLESVVDHDLIPMLEEYWFDDPDMVEKWRRRLSAAAKR